MSIRVRSKGGRGRSTVNKPVYSLAKIAVKYNLDPRGLLSSVVDAWQSHEAKCGHLTITCRKKTGKSIIFLFSLNDEVVAQFPIPEDVLIEPSALEEIEAVAQPMQRRKSTKMHSKTGKMKIEEMKRGMKHVTVKARVVKKPEAKMVATRYGTHAVVSNALVADETDKIKLSLWNKQIKYVSVGDVIKVENAKVSSFRGEKQLRIGRRGEIKVVEDNNFPQINNVK